MKSFTIALFLSIFLMSGVYSQKRPVYDTIFPGKAFNNIFLGIDDSASVCRKIHIRKAVVKEVKIGPRDNFHIEIRTFLQAKGIKFSFYNNKGKFTKLESIEVIKRRKVVIDQYGLIFSKHKGDPVGFNLGRPNLTITFKKHFYIIYSENGIEVTFNRRIRENKISIFKPYYSETENHVIKPY